MIKGDFAHVNSFLEQILLDQGHGKVVCDYWIFRIVSIETLEVFGCFQDESELEKDDRMIKATQVMARLDF